MNAGDGEDICECIHASDRNGYGSARNTYPHAHTLRRMNIEGSTALVTGANRGLGRHFAQQLLERGAAKVYATARDPRTIDLDGVVPLALDITRPESVAAAAAAAPDVTLLINNAGISTGADLITGDLDRIRLDLDTNFYGTLAMVRAFAPSLRRRRDPQRALAAVLDVVRGLERLRRVQGRRVEPDERDPARARRPGHARHRAVS